MDISLLFNFHAEHVLNEFSFFDIGSKLSYYDTKATVKTFHKNFKEKQLPLLSAIIKTTSKKDHKYSLYFSGHFLKLTQEHYPETIKLIKKAVEKEKIEILGGTYHNSVSSLISERLFKLEVEMHSKLVDELFGIKPTCFTNSENIYSNKIGKLIGKMKFQSTIVPAIDWYIPTDNPNRIFKSSGNENLTLILSDQKLSNSLLSSSSIKLQNTSVKSEFLALQVDPIQMSNEMDWIKGISNIKIRKNRLLSIGDAISLHSTDGVYNIPSTLALSPSGHDLSFMTENPLQKEFLQKVKELGGRLNTKKNSKLREDLLALVSQENLMGICIKTNSQNLSEPYDRYLQLMNILSDLEIRIVRTKI